ncbi:uncharacterized protein [Procambarus clarkii]|uniref:uncharacterized protein n=1 Tax=Procambarus clarkii TaxID=6728 RepID=UPI003743F9B6
MYAHIIERRREYHTKWQRMSRAKKRLLKEQANKRGKNENSDEVEIQLLNQDPLANVTTNSIDMNDDYAALSSNSEPNIGCGVNEDASSCNTQMTSEKRYAVVGFNDNTVGIISTTWIEKSDEATLCWWPLSRHTVSAQKHEKPDRITWQVHVISSVLSTTDDFDVAKRRCLVTEDRSNVETDDNVDHFQQRKRKPCFRYEAENAENNKWNQHPSQSKKKCSPSSHENTPSKEISLLQKPCLSGILSETNRTILQKPSPVKNALHNTPSTPSVFPHEDNELVTPSTSVVRTPRSRNLFDPKLLHKNDGSLKEMMQNMSNILQAIYTEHNEQKNIIAELKRDLKILKTTLMKITTKETDKIIEDLIPNPIAAESDLIALNRKLEAESNFRTKFVLLLTSVRGSDCATTVRRIMKKIGTNGLWSLYSMKGQKKKLAFLQKQELYNVILKSSISAHPHVKEQDVTYQISEVLKHAPNRPGGSRYKGKLATDETILQIQDGQDEAIQIQDGQDNAQDVY